MKNGTKLHVVIIDPQQDFCSPGGSLFVPGADKDMQRLSAFVRRVKDKIADIHITIDSHHVMDVAHPQSWKNSKGDHPAPFTLISDSDIENGVWTPTVPSLYARRLAYTKSLSKNGRYPLIIWPEHCLIGTPGQSIVPELMEAVNEWAVLKKATIDFVTKGSNPHTEHYSAVQAEVPDPNDPTTHLNKHFIETIEDADVVVWAGEASSHCVANTMRDTFNNFGTDAVKKMVLLTDAISPVPGFEKNYQDFLQEMTAKGMQTSTTVDFLK